MTRSNRGRSRDAPSGLRLSHWRADGTVKVRYASKEQANRAALGRRLEYGQDSEVYLCEFCGGWHLGGIAR